MSLRDLHAPFYIAREGLVSLSSLDKRQIPLWASFMTDLSPSPNSGLRAGSPASIGWEQQKAFRVVSRGRVQTVASQR